MFKYACYAVALGIALNALGYHSVAAYFPEKAAIYETAARYWLLISIALLSLTRLPANKALYLIMTGLCLFSGSLLIYAVYPKSFLMLLTPLGGLLMIAGFIYMGHRTDI